MVPQQCMVGALVVWRREFRVRLVCHLDSAPEGNFLRAFAFQVPEPGASLAKSHVCVSQCPPTVFSDHPDCLNIHPMVTASWKGPNLIGLWYPREGSSLLWVNPNGTGEGPSRTSPISHWHSWDPHNPQSNSLDFVINSLSFIRWFWHRGCQYTVSLKHWRGSRSCF